ncbi:MAG: TrmH family RNA methyltransferase [Candidatus Latescibacterota bacterium]
MKRPPPGEEGLETSYEVRTLDAALSPEEYARLPKHPLYLLLDQLRSAFNVGSIYRTADAARLAAVLTCGYTAHPPHPKLAKTALGTQALVATEHFASGAEAVEALHRRGVPVWAVETTSRSQRHTEVVYPQPLALVLGNEALGVSRPVLNRCDALVEIPMYGYKNSLNVASAAAVVVFEVLRQWQPAPAARVTGSPGTAP